MSNKGIEFNPQKVKMMKIKILTFLLIFVGLTIFLAPPAKAKVTDEMPIGTTIAPSASYLQSQKRSLASSNESVVSSSATTFGSPRSSFWLANEGGAVTEGESGIGLVGAPISDAGIPALLSMILLYISFRFIQSRKRKTQKENI